jgi:hypothetical protein
MKRLILFALVPMISSCGSVHVLAKKRDDVFLTAKNRDELNGIYNNSSVSSPANTDLYPIWQRLNNKDVYADTIDNPRIQFRFVSDRKLSAYVLSGKRVIEEKDFHGRFRHGYFILRNRLKARSMVGPLLWGFAGFRIYVGITKKNELVLLESNCGSAVLLCLPFFWAGDRLALVYKQSATDQL